MRHLLRRPPRRRTGLRRAALAVTAFAASAGFLGAVAAAGLFLKLRQGPIAFDLRPQIVAALDARVGHGYRFDLAGTAVEATDHGPALTLRGLAVSDGAGRPIASAPSAAIAVDPLALLVGRVSPTRLDVRGVDLRLVVRPDGQVAVSAGAGEAAVPLAHALSLPPAPTTDPVERPAPPPGAAPTPPANGALRAISSALATLVDAATAPDSVVTALERVDVSGRLVLDDRVHGQTRTFENAELGFARGPDGAPELTVAADDGPAGRWRLRARARAAADGTRELSVEADDLSLDEITLAGGLKSLGFDFDMPVSAKLDIGLSPAGDIAAAAGTFNLGSGYFKLDDPDHEPLLIDAVSGRFHLDPASRSVALDGVALRGPTADFDLAGRVGLPAAPGGPWTAQLGASGTFGAERPGEKPIRISRADVSLRGVPAESRYVVEKAEVAGPEVDLSATADVRSLADGVHAHTLAQARRMPAQTLVRLWPSFIAAPVRAWLLANLRGGTVDGGTAVADLDEADFALMKREKSVADGHVRVQFGVSGLALGFMDGVPPLTDVAATGTVTGRTFDLQVARGTLEAGPGRHLALADGSTFRIADNDLKPTPAAVDAHVVGPVAAVADLLSRDALKPYADLPAEAASAHGEVDGRLGVQFLVGKDVPPNSAAVAVAATLGDFGIDKLVGKQGLSDATIKLDVDKAGLRAKGQGLIAGASASVELRKPKGGPAEAVVEATLDAAARARAGLSAPGLKGPVGAKLTATLPEGGDARAAVDLDFTRAAIEGLVPGFSKPAGRPARATLTAVARDGGVLLDDLAFEGAGASVRGSVELSRDGDFRSAKLSQVRLSPGDDMRVEAQGGGDALKVAVRAANLDARPFLKWMSAPGGGDEGAKGALDLDLRAAILTGQNSQAVTGAELRLSRRAGRLRNLALSGRLGRQPLTVSTAQSEGVPHLVIHAGDAGASLLFMDLYKRMAGGRLDADIALPAGRIDGYATVHDFTIRDDPAVRKLAVEGLASQRRDGETPAPAAQGFDPGSMSFRKLEATFTKTGDTIEVRDGSMFGPALGATVAGTIDFRRDQVRLSGTFVPLFGVNNLFSQLPVLGPLLGGGRHEGLLGLSYSLTGSAANPVLSVNPLSVLAPGFLRQIFGAVDGTASRAGAAPPAGSAPLPDFGLGGGE